MATGRSNQLTKQVGEYLVACELARKGLLVATFSGNVPDFDLIATDIKGSSCPIQVKTIKSGSWQFSIEKFAVVNFEGNKQIIGKEKQLSIKGLVCVFVLAPGEYGKDQFYILEWAEVQDIAIANYKHWLDSHGGVRPRKPGSLHCSITPPNLEEHKDKWSIIKERLKQAGGGERE